ncbi:MAG: hypothetical protein ACRDI1_02000 [Actinomycetota bacterium]
MRRLLRATLFTLLIVGLALVPLLIANAQDDRVIKISDDKHFTPPNTNISPGDKLKWRNAVGGDTHNAKSDAGSPEAFDTGDLEGGEESETFTFTKLGEYRYRCSIDQQTAVFFVLDQEPDFSPSPQKTPDDLSTARPPDQQAAASPSPQASPSPSLSPSPSPSPSKSPTPSESPTPRAVSGQGGGISPALVVVIIGLLVAAGAGGGLWWYRKRAGAGEP